MKPQHQTFILSMIKHGDKVQAYRAAYPKCNNDETARKSADRLLRNRPEVAAEIDEAAAWIRQRTYIEAYQKFAEQQKTSLLSMLKRREILAQIATCQMKVGRMVKDGGRYKMLYEDPRPRDIMKAMNDDVKMEEACNRMRNINDPYLAQFYIYIDGRPCDQPHLPPDPNLPPGIFMLPRRRKNQIEQSGIISEHLSRQSGENTLSPSGGGSCEAAGGGTLAQKKSLIEEHGIKKEQNHLSPAGGGGEVRAGGGTLAQEESLIENSGIKTEQKQETPLLPVPPVGDLGELVPPRREENGEMPTAASHSGEVDPRPTLAPEQNQNQAPNPETHLMPKTENQNPGIIWEQNKERDSFPACPDYFDVISELRSNHDSNTKNIQNGVTSGANVVSDRRVDEGSTSAGPHPDPLAASFYKQELQAIASAPPPHILTPEEVKARDEEYAQQHKGKPVKPSTYGKMYFKEKGISYDSLE